MIHPPPPPRVLSVRFLLAGAALALLLTSQPVAAQEVSAEQRYTLVLRDVPLADALSHLVELSRISLLYGPELRRSTPVYCSARDQPAEAVLRCIVESAGKDFYRLSSGTYVVIEPAEIPPRLASLSGVVVCAETGEPLPYANVLLADAGIGTGANASGLFVLSGLLPGEHRLVASYIGYESEVTVVAVPFDGDARRRIELRPEPVAVYPVIVDGLQQRPRSASLGSADLGEDEVRTAGPAGGALRAARSALGIATRPLTHSLHIQGGEAGEHQFQIDGMPVFEPLSLGQLFGSFSPLAVERIAVQKAGFGAAHGSFTAGIIQLDHGLNAAAAAVITADPYALNGRITQRFSAGGRQAAVMVAGRLGLWDVWRVPTLDRLLREWNEIDPLLMAAATDAQTGDVVFTPHRQGSDIGFADVHAAARLQLSPFSTLNVSGFRGASRVATDLFASGADPFGQPDRATLTRDGYHWANTAGQLRYASLLGSRALASIHLRASQHSSRQSYAMIDQDELPADPDFERLERDLAEALDLLTAGNQGNLNQMLELAAGGRMDVSLASGHLMEMGVEVARVENRFDLDGPFYRRLRSENEAWRLAAFAHDQRRLGHGITIESGARITYVPDRQTAYAEPRLALRYDAASGAIGPYSLRLASGVYRQFVNQYDVTAVGPSALVPSVRFWLPVDHSLAPPLAIHLAAEALVSPARGLDIRAETYYKHLPRLLAIDYGALLDHVGAQDHRVLQEAFIGASRGFAYGAGLRIEHTGDDLRLRAGYDFGVSKRTFPSRFDGQLQPTPWSEPHRAMAAAEVTVLPGLAVRAQARAVWGRSWGFRQAYYDVLAAHNSEIGARIGTPESSSLPPLYEVDLGLTYVRQFAGTTVELVADVLNVLDRGNILDYGLRPAGEPGPAGSFVTQPRRMLGLHPMISIRIAR
jgi:hypothetical protein